MGRLSRSTSEDTLRKVIFFAFPLFFEFFFGLLNALISLHFRSVDCGFHGIFLGFYFIFYAVDCSLQAMSKYGRVKNLRLVRDIGNLTFSFFLTLLFGRSTIGHIKD